MKKILMFFLFASVVFVSTGMVFSCGAATDETVDKAARNADSTENQQYEKLLAHYDNMIKILKDNMGNREKALQEEEQYFEKYKQELETLTGEIVKNPMGFADYADKYKSKFEEYNKLKGAILHQQ